MVLDVRWELVPGPQPDAYSAGHIPGSIFVDLERDLTGAPGPRSGYGRHPLPSAESFSAVMRQAGLSARRAAVVLDGSSGIGAARAWWLLRYFGHDDVTLLDGGLAGWVRSGGELETGHPPPSAVGDFAASPGSMPLLDADGASALAARGVLVDARSAERYAGDAEPIDPVAGHIPGARNRPTTLNVGPDDRLLSPDVLRAEFARLEAMPGVEVGVYCGSGITAAHEVLALELAGVSAALYAGSWSDWISDPNRPVAVGGAGQS